MPKLSWSEEPSAFRDDDTLKAKMQNEYDVQIVGAPEFLAILASREKGVNEG
jgi:hypothetical protein